MMRRFLLLPLILLMLLLALPASAEIYVLDELRATLDIPDTYIVLTPKNLATNAEWLQSRDSSAELAASDFEARGVLLQCWTPEYDACFELTATQTEQSLNIFDINEQDNSLRGSYRLTHYPQNQYLNEGYDFSSADWKNTSSGRFLILRYIKRDGGEIAHRGLMRRTIRNGYQITFDMQAFGRSLTNKDNAALNKIWDSFHFVEILPLPPSASAKVNIATPPPIETNNAGFEIQGTASTGVKLTAVTMGLSHPTPVLSEVEVGASGKFKLPINLPKEGVFLITITGEYGGEDVIELAYPVTYQRTLLTVSIPSPPGNVVTDDLLTILGTAEPGASIQIFVNNVAVGMKRVTAAGKFKVDVNTSTEGPYEVALTFSKKDLGDRRVSYTFTRKWSENDMIKELKSQSIKPGYATLTKKIEAYQGRIMGYKSYLVDVTPAGDQWIARMALTKRGDEYTSIFLVTCPEAPNVPIGGQVTMYGTCVGMSSPGDDNETQASFPCFELLLFVSLE